MTTWVEKEREDKRNRKKNSLEPSKHAPIPKSIENGLYQLMSPSFPAPVKSRQLGALVFRGARFTVPRVAEILRVRRQLGDLDFGTTLPIFTPFSPPILLFLAYIFSLHNVFHHHPNKNKN